MNKLRLTDEEINKVKRRLCGLNNNHGCIQLLDAQIAHLAAVKDGEIVEMVGNQLSQYGQAIIFAIGEVIPPDKADWIAKRRSFIAKDILSLIQSVLLTRFEKETDRWWEEYAKAKPPLCGYDEMSSMKAMRKKMANAARAKFVSIGEIVKEGKSEKQRGSKIA